MLSLLASCRGRDAFNHPLESGPKILDNMAVRQFRGKIGTTARHFSGCPLGQHGMVSGGANTELIGPFYRIGTSSIGTFTKDLIPCCRY